MLAKRIVRLLLVPRHWITISQLATRFKSPESTLSDKIRDLHRLEKTRHVNELQKKQKEELRLAALNDLYSQLEELNDSNKISLLIYLTGISDKRYIAILDRLFTRLTKNSYQGWNSYEVYYFVRAGQQLIDSDSRQQRYLNKIVEVVSEHIESLDLNFIFSFLVMFQKALNKKKVSQSEKPKHLALFQRIQKRTLRCLEETGPVSPVNKKVLESPHFYITFLDMGHLSNYACRQLYVAMEQKILDIIQHYSRNVTERFKTWVICYHKLSKAALGGDKMLDWATNAYEKDSLFRQEVDGYDPNYLSRVCYGYAHNETSKAYRQIRLQDEGGCKVFRAGGKALQKFTAHPFIKLIAGRLPQSAQYRQIALFYPEVFTKTDTEQHFNTTTGHHNQFMQVVRNELKRLDVKFEEEKIVQGRYCDFVVNDELVIEVDGDIHYDTRTGLQMPSTMFRNLSFLYGGKRLLVLQLSEYHIARQHNQLSEYVRYKLEHILKDKDILMAK